MKKMVSFLSIVFLALTLACNGSGDSSVSIAEEFADELNYHYNNGPNEEFVLVKPHGYDDYNYAVYYDELTGQYSAYNLALYSPGMSFEQYLINADNFDVHYNLYPLGNGYYEGDFGMIFEEGSAESKDLEKIAAFMEEKQVTEQGEKISAEFGLSESRGIQVARLAREWENLSKKRSMTSKDANAFSEQLLGVSLTKAITAVKKSTQGEKKELEDLMDKAAEVNGTTPEHINELFNELLTK